MLHYYATLSSRSHQPASYKSLLPEQTYKKEFNGHPIWASYVYYACKGAKQTIIGLFSERASPTCFLFVAGKEKRGFNGHGVRTLDPRDCLRASQGNLPWLGSRPPFPSPPVRWTSSSGWSVEEKTRDKKKGGEAKRKEGWERDRPS